MSQTVTNGREGEYICAVLSIEREKDCMETVIYFMRLQIVSGPNAGEVIKCEYRIVSHAVRDRFKRDIQLLGIPAKNWTELEKAMVVGYGKRLRLEVHTNEQGFTACQILEVIEGDIPPEEDWLQYCTDDEFFNGIF